MTWRRLVCRDDWGKIYCAWKDEESKHSTACAKRGLQFKKDQIIKARLPTGKVCTLRVKLETKTRVVDDMGHSYTVQSVMPRFIVDWNGLELVVPAEKIQIWDTTGNTKGRSIKTKSQRRRI